MRTTRNLCRCALRAALVVALFANVSQAGPRRGGDARAGANERLQQYAPENQPFTAQWYLDHPQAWRYTHPHADAWTVATFAGATAWLGLAAAPATASYSTVYEAAVVAPSDAEQVESAGDLVHEGDLEPNSTRAEDWLPLGVFALVPPDSERANHMVQLAIHKDGAVQGTYYDVLSDAGQPIYGSVDPQSQRVAWAAGSGDGVIFETTLSSLTQPQGTVLLHFRNGQTQKWQILRQQAAQD